jgi:hypothetical protein
VLAAPSAGVGAPADPALATDIVAALTGGPLEGAYFSAGYAQTGRQATDVPLASGPPALGSVVLITPGRVSSAGTPSTDAADRFFALPDALDHLSALDLSSDCFFWFKPEQK